MIKIEPLDFEDLPAAHALYCGLEDLTRSTLSLESLAADWEDSGPLFLKAVEGGRMIGWIGGKILDGTESEIRYLGVDREYWGRGAGRALVRSFFKELPPQGVVYLEVAETNAGAIRFYENFGGQKIHTRPGYYDQGQVGAWVFKLEVAFIQRNS